MVKQDEKWVPIKGLDHAEIKAARNGSRDYAEFEGSLTSGALLLTLRLTQAPPVRSLAAAAAAAYKLHSIFIRGRVSTGCTACRQAFGVGCGQQPAGEILPAFIPLQ